VSTIISPGGSGHTPDPAGS